MAITCKVLIDKIIEILVFSARNSKRAAVFDAARSVCFPVYFLASYIRYMISCVIAAPAMAVMLLGSLSGSTSTISAATTLIPLSPLSTFRTKSELGPPITGVPVPGAAAGSRGVNVKGQVNRHVTYDPLQFFRQFFRLHVQRVHGVNHIVPALRHFRSG